MACVGDVEAVVCAELERCGDGERDVALLMLAGERRVYVDDLAIDGEGVLIAPGVWSVGILRGARGGAGRKAACGVDAADVEVDGDLADCGVGFRMLRECDEDAIGAQDAGFFGGDGAEGVAEEFDVVEADVGDDGDERLDDVGGVEAAAESDFEDGDVDVLLGVEAEGDGGEELEEAGRVGEFAGGDEFGGAGVDEREEAGEVVVGNLGELGRCAGGDANALGGAEQMRRGVEAGFEARGVEDGGERGGG